MALGSFIFDANTETPDSVARRRAIADALLKQAMGYSQPKSVLAAVGQGLGDLGEVLAARRNNSRADQAETAGRASVGDLSALFGGGDSSSDGSVAATGNGDISTVANPGELSASIQATAQKLGIDPVDLGTAISYETAGTFDPWKAGPTTQWGQHRGLIQWGEPQRAKYGVTAGMPISAQMDAVGKYLTDAGVKPGMGLLDIYSAINAGRVGRYNASDAGNGGAPGTVRDKVLQQMGGHRAKALALLKAMQGQPTQVASLDPSAGAASAFPSTVTDGEVAPQGVSPAQAFTSPIPGSDNDPTGMAAGVLQPGPAIAKVAQALQGRQAGMGAPSANPSVQKVAQAMSQRARAAMGILQNPWADESQKAIAGAVLKQEMEQNDPARQLAMRKAQLELQQLEHPAPKTVVINGHLVNEQTGQEIANFPTDPKPPGVEEIYDPKTGQPYKAIWNPKTGQFEQVGGVKAPSGTSLTVGPDGTVQFQQGGGKPLTEGQAKDTVFVTRASGALPLIDKYGDALTNLGERVGGGVPIIGNYLKSPEYQQAEQSGKEFLQAILRKDTGAAITPAETEEYGSVYLPRPGDSPELLAQKKASRQRALKALTLGLPPQAILSLEKADVDLPDIGQGTPAAPDAEGWTVLPNGVKIRKKAP